MLASGQKGRVSTGQPSFTDAEQQMARIAFIDYFPTHYRRRLYEEIARRADVDFFFFSDQRERWSDPNVPAVWEGDYRRIDLPRRYVGGEPIMPGILQRLLAGRYEAVVKSPNGKAMLPLTYAAAKMSRTGFVLWSGMWLHPRSTVHRFSRPLMEGIYRGSEAIVTYGEHVKQFVLETRGVVADKIFVAGQAVNGELFEATPPVRDSDPPEIVYVGQFKEFKGLPYLFDAFERLTGTGARLRMIGGGILHEWARERARRLQGVELVGYRTQEELPAELARARCLVLPSITTALDREPWGLVCNEALHAGVPVVTTDAVGAAAGGLVVDGRNGFVVPERNAEALATALRRLVENPRLAAQLGDAGRVDVSAFNHARMAEAFVAAAEYAIAQVRG